MNKELSELLRELALKLGTTVDHLYAVLVRQAWISALQNFLFFVVVSTLWLAVYRLIKRKYTPEKEGRGYSYEQEWSDEPGPVISMVLIGLIWLVSAGCVCESVTQALLNPEFYALDKILEALK